MKNYILPALISLTLGSSAVLAADAAAPAQGANMPPFADAPAKASAPAAPKAESTEAAASKPTQPAAKSDTSKEMSAEEVSKAMAEKRDEYRKSMFELGDKIHAASTPEEREKLIQEGREKRKKHFEEMHELMSKRGFPAPPPMDGDYYGPRGGPGYGRGPGYGPNWDNGDDDDADDRDVMPPPGYGCSRFGGQNGPGNGMAGGPGGRFQAMQEHHKNMEKHLGKIEKILEQVLEKLSTTK